MTRKEIVSTLALVTIVAGLSVCKPKPAEESPAGIAEEPAAMVVQLTPEALKTAGIRTEPALFRPAVRTIHVPGEIIFNPKRLSHVTARAAGRVEQLLAFPGDRVAKGQALLQLYSQEFLATQAEFLQASRSLKHTPEDAAERAPARSFYDSAKSKLRVLDLGDAEIEAIEASAALQTLLSVRAPLDGTVIESAVTSGDYLQIGASLFRMADLSNVWAEMKVYEKDLAAVREGLSVIFRASDFGGREFHGRLFQLGQIVDAKTRTIDARAELANQDGRLRPGMFVEADIIAPANEDVLAVPSSAIQEVQTRKVVFVLVQDQTFAVRDVTVGASYGGYVEILKGLAEKETVATTGSFFLKSELLKKTLGEN
jgi:RND family efflux transporter MFP subunit